MKTAVVILNWNGRHMLDTYLPRVVACCPDDAEVVVADNASTDDSVTFLQKNFPRVRLIVLDKNYGFAEGYNRALQQVEACYYVLLNSDVRVTPHWLELLVNFMDTHAEVAACQPKLLAEREPEKFEYAGACGGFLDKLGYPFCRGRVFDCVETDEGQYNTPSEILWATGACMLVRSADYWQFGGLDGRFFAHNEEIDLCWRMCIGGKKVYCLPESVVYHVGGGTLPKGNPMKTFLNFRNNLTMLYKNLPEKDLRKVMLWRWFLDYVAAWQMLLVNRNVADFKAVYRARKAFKQWLPDFRKDRELIQSQRKDSGVCERQPVSILWQYYVRGKRTFSAMFSR